MGPLHSQLLSSSIAFAVISTLVSAGGVSPLAPGRYSAPQPKAQIPGEAPIADPIELPAEELSRRQNGAGNRTSIDGAVEATTQMFCPGTPLQLAGPDCCGAKNGDRVRSRAAARARRRSLASAVHQPAFADDLERVVLDRFSSQADTNYIVANNGRGQLVIRVERPGFTRSLIYDYGQANRKAASDPRAAKDKGRPQTSATELIEARVIPWFDDNVLLALAEECDGEIVYRYAFSYSARRDAGNASPMGEAAWFRSEPILRTRGKPLRIVELRNDGADSVEITLRRGRIHPGSKLEAFEEFIFVDVCPGGPFMEGRCILMDISAKQSLPFGALR